MMVLPELMVKIWDGDLNEFFTYVDMNRVCYNANILAQEAGVEQVQFIETTRASQFRYDEAQKLENLLKTIADRVGVPISIETSWGFNRVLSFVDFERWEANTWAIYFAMGGVGERIPAGKFLVTYSATLFADSWKGAGPYWQDLTMPAVFPNTEAVAFVSHSATLAQRMDELNAGLRLTVTGDRSVRAWARDLRPRGNIPIRVAVGGLQMHQEINLTASGWVGSGPWTQTVTVSSAPVDAVIGQWEGMTDAAVLSMTRAVLSVAAVNGTQVTVRAMVEKPTIALNPMILWDVSNVE